MEGIGLGEKSCENCIHLVKAKGKDKAQIFVCTNKEDSEGTLYLPDTSDTVCRNFQTIDRPVVVQPANPEIRLISLTQGKFAIVDAADYDWLKKYKWHLLVVRNKIFYAGSYFDGRFVKMHRLIMNPPSDMVIDHIDRNGLNNTRSNLRICTARQNSYNRKGRPTASKYKGVIWSTRRNKWIARIRNFGMSKQIGSFKNEISAAKAYDLKAAELFGEFAYLNFPVKS
jgi:hypothetical protein